MNNLRENHEEFIKNYKLMLKPQQRLRHEKHTVFIEEVIKIQLSANNQKRTQLIDPIGTHAYQTRKYLVCKKEETKCNNIIKQFEND